jgi:Na+/melibiose symporter-like transporter
MPDSNHLQYQYSNVTVNFLMLEFLTAFSGLSPATAGVFFAFYSNQWTPVAGD